MSSSNILKSARAKPRRREPAVQRGPVRASARANEAASASRMSRQLDLGNDSDDEIAVITPRARLRRTRTGSRRLVRPPREEKESTESPTLDDMSDEPTPLKREGKDPVGDQPKSEDAKFKKLRKWLVKKVKEFTKESDAWKIEHDAMKKEIAEFKETINSELTKQKNPVKQQESVPEPNTTNPTEGQLPKPRPGYYWKIKPSKRQIRRQRWGDSASPVYSSEDNEPGSAPTQTPGLATEKASPPTDNAPHRPYHTEFYTADPYSNPRASASKTFNV